MTSDVAASLIDASPQRKLWDVIPCGGFVRLDGSSAFSRSYPLILLKTRQLITGVEPTTHVVGRFSLVHLELVSCGGVPCAYLLQTHRCSLRVRPTYCVLSARGEPVREGSTLFTDGTLGMVGDDGAVCAFVYHSKWISLK